MQSGGRTAESSAQQPGNMGMMRSLRCLGFCCLHGNVYSLLTMHVDMKDSFLGNKIFNFLDYLSIVNCGYIGIDIQEKYFDQVLMLALF